MIAKQFTVYLPNKPGELANVTRGLAAENVNILGISVSESTDVGLVQIVSDNPKRTRQVFLKCGVPFTVQEVALVLLPDEVGALAKGLARLAKAGVNINYVYATGCGCAQKCECYAVFSAPDLRAVEKAWGRR